MFKNTPELSQQMLQSLYYALQNGAIHIFSGNEPANAADALDMSAEHTHLCTLTLNGNGTTGLSLDSPNGNLIAKPVNAVWKGLIAFDGTEAGATALTPTFFRFCADGDDGRNQGNNAPRIQGSAGGPASGADMLLGSDLLTDDGSSTVTLSIFNYRLA